MTAVSTLPLNPVTSVTITSDTLMGLADGNYQEPYPVYEFGGGRKKFYNNMQDDGVYGKPVTVTDGVTTHTADPDLVSTNP